ncbi:putative virion structural protein [Erwinia phage PhiEaH1]|jgi:hypothetical protein|uniref:Putative virion structural protein n=1 Tax=Erwinia phage PhiEaH1 TaxID=1401669 RepID=W8CZX2_9CAUD|nr:putative virion structural protein [Erwinia phage PhiEaH1]AGX01805.1 putative virion structural protein [Erwinia phage PhiEaH1]
MGNKLSWVNNNALATNVEIYRSLTPLDTANLSNPLITLTNGETAWEDTGVVYGATYNYVIQMVTKDGSQKAPTRNIVMQTGLGRGLGPNLLQQGDERLGYFGSIAATDFIPAATLQASQAGSGLSVSGTATWHKFVRRGKILYVPNTYLSSAVTMTQLYQAGWVFGTDDNGPTDGQLSTAQNQRRVVSYRGDRYFLRLPRGYADADNANQYDLSNTTGLNHDNVANTPECEFNDLFYPVVQNTPLKQRLFNVDSITAANFVVSSTRAVLCQEVSVSKGAMLSRGNSNGLTGRDIMTYMQAIPTARAASTLLWYPVLELIED